MRTIWKFPLQMRGWNAVPIGPEAKVVLAAIDPSSGAPAIWAELDAPEVLNEGNDLVQFAALGDNRYFGVFPTGGRIAENADHVGSMVQRGEYIWHVYERT